MSLSVQKDLFPPDCLRHPFQKKFLLVQGRPKVSFFYLILLLLSARYLVGNGLESQLHTASQLIGALYCYIRCVVQMKEVMLWS